MQWGVQNWCALQGVQRHGHWRQQVRGAGVIWRLSSPGAGGDLEARQCSCL